MLIKILICEKKFYASWIVNQAYLEKALSETLLGAISELNLDINDCTGQSYDGWAAVSWSTNDTAAHKINKNSKDIYAQYLSHRLNLSICKICKIQSISHAME